LKDARKVWRIFAKHYYLFRGTPTRMWLDFAFQELFGLENGYRRKPPMSTSTRSLKAADAGVPAPRTLRALHLEVLATTDSPIDSLEDHKAIIASGWKARFCRTSVPIRLSIRSSWDSGRNIATLGEQTGEDTSTWPGYLNALRRRALVSRTRLHGNGSRASHGADRDLDATEAFGTFQQSARAATRMVLEEELFRAQMLTEMARMSLEDGLVMQIHPGLCATTIARSMSATAGTWAPTSQGRSITWMRCIRCWDRFGNENSLTIILFTLDESTYSRELAPLAGTIRVWRLGPPCVNDSPEGMTRFREQATETAGFYNTVGFNDDTRAFLSIPGAARWVATHGLRIPRQAGG